MWFSNFWSGGTMAARTDVVVRWMIRRDMRSVLAIENQSSEFPWDENEFVTVFRERDCTGMVAEIDEDVVGYMIYRLRRDKLELLTFAVDPKYRRSGIGRSLIGRLIHKLDGRRTKAVVEVRDSNLPAQLFFRSMGFLCTVVSKNHYKEGADDAYVMEYSVGG